MSGGYYHDATFIEIHLTFDHTVGKHFIDPGSARGNPAPGDHGDANQHVVRRLLPG